MSRMYGGRSLGGRWGGKKKLASEIARIVNSIGRGTTHGSVVMIDTLIRTLGLYSPVLIAVCVGVMPPGS